MENFIDLLQVIVAMLQNPGGLIPDLNPADWMQMDWGGITNTISDKWDQAGSLISGFMIDLCNNKLLTMGLRWAETATQLGRNLAAIFALIVAAGQAYKVMAAGEKFNVLAIGRPILFSFVFGMWPFLCQILLAPGAEFERWASEKYIMAAHELSIQRKARNEEATKMAKMLATQKVAAEEASESSTWIGKLGDFVQDGINMVTDLLASLQLVLTSYLFYIIETVFICIGEMVFGVCVYIVFLTKVLYITVLVMFGPITMACSILDVWKDAWAQWVGKMVAVSLYGGMAYLVMWFATNIIIATVMQDTANMSKIAAQGLSGVTAYFFSGLGTCMMCVVGYAVGGFAMSAVPEMASMAFPSQTILGAGSFIGGVQGYAKKRTPGGGAVF